LPERVVTTEDILTPLLVERATWEIGVQLGDSDAVDAKSLGLLTASVGWLRGS
jgi:hypothetical protein